MFNINSVHFAAMEDKSFFLLNRDDYELPVSKHLDQGGVKSLSISSLEFSNFCLNNVFVLVSLLNIYMNIKLKF